MSYKLADGTTEGDYLGFLQFAETIEPDSAIETYLASAFQPKKGGAIPSPRTAATLQVSPGTAAAMVSGNPGALAPAISSYLRKMQAAGFDEPEDPDVYRVSRPAGGWLPMAAGAAFLLWIVRRGGRRRTRRRTR